MRQKALLIMILTCLSIPQFASREISWQPYANKNLYFELGGNLQYLSLNFEKMISPNFYWRIGITGMGATAMLTALIGKRNHFFEAGIGVFYYEEIEFRVKDRGFTGRIGYRYQPQYGGIFFSAAVTPFYEQTKPSTFWLDMNFYFWAGIGVGVSFR